jgi:hypothetical protein
MNGTIKPAMSRRSLGGRRSSHWPDSRRLPRAFFNQTHATDCTGVFDVMAKQVRPGLANPARFKGPQQSADLIRRQPAHSIRARGQAPLSEAECMAAISTCFTGTEKRLATEGVHVCRQDSLIQPSADRTGTVSRPGGDSVPPEVAGPTEGYQQPLF